MDYTKYSSACALAQAPWEKLSQQDVEASLARVASAINLLVDMMPAACPDDVTAMSRTVSVLYRRYAVVLGGRSSDLVGRIDASRGLA